MYTKQHIIDTVHTGHIVEVIETVRDNPVEFTVWARCHDCDATFMAESTTLVEDDA